MKPVFLFIATMLVTILFSCGPDNTPTPAIVELEHNDSVTAYINTGLPGLTPPVHVIDFGNHPAHKTPGDLQYLNLDKISYSVKDFKSTAPKVFVQGEIFFALAGSNLNQFLKIATVPKTDLQLVAQLPDLEQAMSWEAVNMATLKNYIQEGKKVSFMVYGYGDAPFEATFKINIRTIYTVKQ